MPYRFETDIQAIRAMAWVEPGEPLQLTLRRGSKILDLQMIPTAADPQRQHRLSEWLSKLERDGKACFSCQDGDPAASANTELLNRIRQVGGKAMLKVKPLAQGGVDITSAQVEIPAGLQIDPAYSDSLKRLPKGKSLLLLVKVTGSRSEWLPEGAPGFENIE